MRLASLGLALALVAGAVHCRKAPPPQDLTPALKSLRSPDYDPDHGLGYWTRSLDRRHDDGEWERAIAFCETHDADDHPNCRTVELLTLASRIPGFRAEEVLP